MNSHDGCHTPLKRACLTYSSTLAYNFRLLSYYTHSFCICQVFYFFFGRMFHHFLLALRPDIWYNTNCMYTKEGGRGGCRSFLFRRTMCAEAFLTLDGENAAHVKVLRLRRGDSVLVCDGCGTDYRCTVSDISPQQVCLVVNSTEASGAEPLVACSVYMAYAKADKLEHVIQKATELGAYEIAAFPSSRCVLKLDAASAEKRRERWQKNRRVRRCAVGSGPNPAGARAAVV